jgi:hypothetical protein
MDKNTNTDTNINNNTDLDIALTDMEVNVLKKDLDILQDAANQENLFYNSVSTDMSSFDEAFPLYDKDRNVFKEKTSFDHESFNKLSGSVSIESNSDTNSSVYNAIKEAGLLDVFAQRKEEVLVPQSQMDSLPLKEMSDIISLSDGILKVDLATA